MGSRCASARRKRVTSRGFKVIIGALAQSVLPGNLATRTTPCAAAEGTTINQVVEGYFGVSAEVVGLTLWIPGVVSLVGANARLRELNAQPIPAQPHAAIISLPPLRF